MSAAALISYDVIPITKSDTATFAAGCVKCTGTSGTVVMKTYAGNTRTVTISVGETLNVLCTMVFTASTATGLELYPVI